jgi:hypothetical protein
LTAQALDAATIAQTMKADMMFVRSYMIWLMGRIQSYNQNLTVPVMNAAGISASDQSMILQFITDCNGCHTFCMGTLPAFASDIMFNITNYLELL